MAVGDSLRSFDVCMTQCRVGTLERDQSLPSHACVYTCACIDARTPKAIILRTASSRLMQKEGSKAVSPASWRTIASSKVHVTRIPAMM
jgi:hypothetical protein